MSYKLNLKPKWTAMYALLQNKKLTPKNGISFYSFIYLILISPSDHTSLVYFPNKTI